MRTFSIRPADVTREWYLIDASDANLGRIAQATAQLLIGKGKPAFTPHVDGGDYVVIINAGHLKASGKKFDQKIYYRHSGHPGNLKSKSLKEQIEDDAAKVIKRAVRGMIPANKLRNKRLARLKIYSDDVHLHEGQKPASIEILPDGSIKTEGRK